MKIGYCRVSTQNKNSDLQLAALKREDHLTIPPPPRFLLSAMRAGFTLLELSISLVIIGLIIGGILVGRDLIHAAELRGDISEVQKFDTAVNAFKLKFNCLPGDCLNATDYFGASVHNGNGDGFIEGGATMPGLSLDGSFIGTEVAAAIAHLAYANLIAVSPFDSNDGTVNIVNVTPKLRSGSNFVVLVDATGVQQVSCCTATGHHAYRLGVSQPGGAYPAWYPGSFNTKPANYTPQDGYYIDGKIDDGHAESGTVYAGANSYADDNLTQPMIGFACPDIANGINANCDYDLTNSQRVIGIFIRANF